MMSHDDDAALNRGLIAYLRARGLPAPLATLSARLTRSVTLECAITCNAKPAIARGCDRLIYQP
jgi:hypothetical protein